MFRIILRKEIIAHVLSARFVLLMVLCIVLIPLSLYVNLNDYQIKQDAKERMTADYRTNWEQAEQEELPLPDPGGFRKHAPLSILARGYDDRLPVFFQTSKEGITMETAEIQEEPIISLFGHFDLLFIVKIVFSFLALLFTFEAVVGEKEKRTLRLMLSYPVPRDQILLGKLMGGYFTLVVPFILSIMIGAVILVIRGFPILGNGIFSGFALFVCFALLYIMVFYNLGLLVSSKVHSSLSSFTILLFMWVLLVLVVPPVAGIVAKIAYPVKSYEVLELEKAAIKANMQREKLKVLNEEVARAGIFKDSAPLSDPQEWQQYQQIRQAIAADFDQRGIEAIGKLDDDYQRKVRRRTAVSQWLSRLSPLSSFTYLATNICGTGPQERDNFLERSRGYQDQIAGMFYDKTWKDAVVINGAVWNLGGSAPDRKSKEDLPEFEYQVAGAQFDSSNGIDLLLLIMFNLVFFAGSYVSFLRYDVR